MTKIKEQLRARVPNQIKQSISRSDHRDRTVFELGPAAIMSLKGDLARGQTFNISGFAPGISSYGLSGEAALPLELSGNPRSLCAADHAIA